MDNFFGSSPLFGAKKKFLFSEAALSETHYLHPTSDALPFDVEGKEFEISGLHKAAMLCAPLFIRPFLIPNPKI